VTVDLSLNYRRLDGLVDHCQTEVVLTGHAEPRAETVVAGRVPGTAMTWVLSESEVVTQNNVASLDVEGVAKQGPINATPSQTTIVPVSKDLLRCKLLPDQAGQGTVALSGIERDVQARAGKTADRRSINLSRPGLPCQPSAVDPPRTGPPFSVRA
jgi:hypothetical protein